MFERAWGHMCVRPFEHYSTVTSIHIRTGTSIRICNVSYIPFRTDSSIHVRNVVSFHVCTATFILICSVPSILDCIVTSFYVCTVNSIYGCTVTSTHVLTVISTHVCNLSSIHGYKGWGHYYNCNALFFHHWSILKQSTNHMHRFVGKFFGPNPDPVSRTCCPSVLAQSLRLHWQIVPLQYKWHSWKGY